MDVLTPAGGSSPEKVKKMSALIVKMSNKEHSHTKYMYIYKPIWIPHDKLFMDDSAALQVFL